MLPRRTIASLSRLSVATESKVQRENFSSPFYRPIALDCIKVHCTMCLHSLADNRHQSVHTIAATSTSDAAPQAPHAYANTRRECAMHMCKSIRTLLVDLLQAFVPRVSVCRHATTTAKIEQGNGRLGLLPVQPHQHERAEWWCRDSIVCCRKTHRQQIHMIDNVECDARLNCTTARWRRWW